MAKEKKSEELEEENYYEESESVEKSTGKKVYKITDLPGVGPAVATKLAEAGVTELMNIAVLSPSDLSDMSGVSEAVARKIIQASRKMLDLGFQNASDFMDSRKEINFITTGSKNLDNLLGGKGLESKSITEAYGAYGSGKCVTKNTVVSYFNDNTMHLQDIQDVYSKYNQEEFDFEEGKAIPLFNVKVLCFSDNNLEIKKASHLYKEKVKNILRIRTRRGRILEITKNHQLLTFENGLCWKKALDLKNDDAIAYPKEFNISDEANKLSEDDAYFLGLFVAEGTHNPFSLCNSNETVITWIKNYVQRRFEYSPTTKVDRRNENPVYTILLRNPTKSIMYGLENTNSSDKFIPEIIFNSNRKVISSFLAGYLEGDGEISKDIVAATTKSKKLASQLTYLFLRLGISTTLSKKIVKGEEFFVVFVVGEDREKINDFPFKFKKAGFSGVNSEFGIPKQIVSFLREKYKLTIGGGRGKQRKKIGKINSDSMAYRHLTHNEIVANVNSGTFNAITNLFSDAKRDIEETIKLLKDDLSNENIRKIFSKLPFAFNSIANKLGIKKSSIRNYNLRKIPENRKEILKSVLLEELSERKEKIEDTLEVMEKLDEFRWDWVDSVEEIDYDDYVYDFVVPETHSFIGGNMPTIMHNTQLALSLAVNVQLPYEKGGCDGKAVYIDTEGTFKPERVKQIASAIGLDSSKALKNIMIARAFNSDHQMLLVDKVADLIKQGENIKLLIVDSITSHFRAEFAGRGTLADRQQKINKHLHDLIRLAEQYNLVIYITNQVMTNPAMMFGDPTTAIGGNIIGHASTYRLYFRRGKAGSRVAKMIDAPNLPENETIFYLTTAGLRDDGKE